MAKKETLKTIRDEDIRKIKNCLSDIQDSRQLLDDFYDCSDDLKSLGFIIGKAFAILDRAETELINVMDDIDSTFNEEN